MPAMRLRKPLVIAAGATGLFLFAFAGCRTTVRVVDDAGLPVPGAAISPVWPSVGGEVTVTDADGHARLHDAWSMLGAPRWLHIHASGRLWQIDYPPPAVIRLVPAAAVPLPARADRSGTAAEDPRRAR
jgi:hypothetical protein